MNNIRLLHLLSTSMMTCVVLMAHANDYKITDLGTLGGTSSTARDINDQRQVVGMSTYEPGVGTSGYDHQHAFLWEDGVTTFLGTLGGEYSIANAINDSGQIVGMAAIDDDSPRSYHAAIWNNGVIGDLAPDGNSGSAAAINDLGHIALTTEYQVFMWTDGVLDLLGDVGAMGYLRDINNKDQVVGASRESGKAYLWENGNITYLEALDSDSGIVLAINNNGLMVGASLNQNTLERQRAVYWADGSINQLDSLSPLVGGCLAADINDKGMIVGSCYKLAYNREPTAVYWVDGAVVNLNKKVFNNTGWHLESANAVNELGDIVGSGQVDTNGDGYYDEKHAFLAVKMTPITIDIQPDEDPNIIDLSSDGFIPVAILTEGEFDALQVDPETAKFGLGEVLATRYEVVDVDSDGDQDLLLYYRIQQSGIVCLDTQARLVAELYDGSDIIGTDSIMTVGCNPKALIEAESMALGAGYVVESNTAASSGKAIRRLAAGGNPATASTQFAGPAGTYDITVAYFDENDGMSSMAFILNGEMLDQWTADEDPVCSSCDSPVASALRERVVATGVRLQPGDELTLQGTGEHYEYARFDKVTLSAIGSNNLEAEMMTLKGGYAVEANAAASGGQLIRRLDSGGNPGTASTQYKGPEGTYDIAVSYVDENDGRSSLAILLNGQLLDEWTADEDPMCCDCASPGASTLRTRVVAKGVRLQPGDELTLQGTGEHYEYARFDKITLAPVGFTTLEAETMTLDDGFVVEANAAASDGQIIKNNGLADSVPGRASAGFMGSEGQYDITVTYFDEYDGISSMAFFLNNQLLDQWLADENPACAECASPNERTLRSRVVARGIEISPDDEIRLESTVNQYEFGRFDKVDFTRNLSP